MADDKTYYVWNAPLREIVEGNNPVIKISSGDEAQVKSLIRFRTIMWVAFSVLVIVQMSVPYGGLLDLWAALVLLNPWAVYKSAFKFYSVLVFYLIPYIFFSIGLAGVSIGPGHALMNPDPEGEDIAKLKIKPRAVFNFLMKTMWMLFGKYAFVILVSVTIIRILIHFILMAAPGTGMGGYGLTPFAIIFIDLACVLMMFTAKVLISIFASMITKRRFLAFITSMFFSVIYWLGFFGIFQFCEYLKPNMEIGWFSRATSTGLVLISWVVVSVIALGFSYLSARVVINRRFATLDE